MGATGQPQGPGDFKEYTSGQSDAVTWAGAGLADWIQIIGAGVVVVTTEKGNNRTITVSATEGAACLFGPFSALVSTSSAYVRMGIGKPPQLPAVTVTEPDYVFGTDLTDIATTTVQRVGPRTAFLLAGTMSQGETITLGTTGAVSGDWMLIARTSTSAQTAAIVNGGAGAGTLHTQPASKVNFTEARFNGTNWILMRCGSA